MPGSYTGDQDWRKNDVDQHGHQLHDHRRLRDTGAAQRGPHHCNRKLQRQAGPIPVQVAGTRRHGRRIGAERGHVPPRERVARHQRDQREQHGEHQRLVEREVRPVLVLSAHRMGYDGHGTHAQHLRKRQYRHCEVARRADTRQRGTTLLRDEIQIDHEIQRLDQHADRHRRSHRKNVPGDGPDGQVFHGSCADLARYGRSARCGHSLLGSEPRMHRIPREPLPEAPRGCGDAGRWQNSVAGAPQARIQPASDPPEGQGGRNGHDRARLVDDDAVAAHRLAVGHGPLHPCDVVGDRGYFLRLQAAKELHEVLVDVVATVLGHPPDLRHQV